MNLFSPLHLLILSATCLFAESVQVLTTNELPRLAATEPVASLQKFSTKEGFRIDLVAAEPLVVDPVAFCFDEFGRLFVVEMRDYSEHRSENLGRIRLLEDTDADGVFDKSSVYAKNLAWPTGIICSAGGVYVLTTPDLLYLKDTDGDGLADVREVALTGFGLGQEKLNVQSLPNSLSWGPDNRIHGASGGAGGILRNPKLSNAPTLDVRSRDFSFNPATREVRAETGGGQYGIAFDNWGRKFVCSNSSHARTVLYEDAYSNRSAISALASAAIDIAVEGPAAEIYRISPDERWRVIRTQWRLDGVFPGLLEGGGRVSGYFSGATGLTIFRGDAWGSGFVGDLFVADCGANIIHHKTLTRTNGLPSASRPADEQKREFIASRDNWFRPVQLGNGPDGNLYVADMYREVIEHPWSLPEPIKKLVDLDSGNDRGRMYRIVQKDYAYHPPVFPGRVTSSELFDLLDHPNGWHRDTASRLILEKKPQDTETGLHQFLKRAATPWGKIHALNLLVTLGILHPQEISTAIQDTHPAVRVHGIRVSESILRSKNPTLKLMEELTALAIDKEPEVRIQLAHTASYLPSHKAEQILARLFAQEKGNNWLLNAIIMSAHHCADRLLETSLLTPFWNEGDLQFATHLAQIVSAQATADQLIKLIQKFPATLPSNHALALTKSLLGNRSIAQGRSILEKTTLLSTSKSKAMTRSASTSERAIAIQLLAFQDWGSLQPIFRDLLAEPLPTACLKAAILTLHQIDQPFSLQLILTNLAQFDTPNRTVAIDPFLRRPEKFALLDALLQTNSPSESFTVTELSLISDARRRFGAKQKQTTPDDRSAIYNQYATALNLKGDSLKGRQIFEERCAVCHRFKGIGSAVGTDLSGVKSNPREVILNNIVDPNREIAARYQTVEATMKDGEILQGLIVAETEKTLTLRMPGGLDSTVQRADIKGIQIRPESLMPSGLESGLDLSAMASLIEFITN